MSKQKMLDAKELMARKRYDEARDLLEDLDHPKAREMLAQIEHEINRRQSGSDRSSALRGFIVTALISAILTIGLIAALVFFTRPGQISRLLPGSAQTTPAATRAAEAGVEPTAEATSEITEVPAITGVVTSNQSINVRSGAGTNFETLRSIQPGVEVEVLGQNNDGSWINVRLSDSSEGWVSASLLTLSEPLATPTALAETATPEVTEVVVAECSGAEGADWWNSGAQIVYVQSRYFLALPNNQDALGGLSGQRQALAQIVPPECVKPTHDTLLAALDTAITSVQSTDPAGREQARAALRLAAEAANETLSVGAYLGDCPIDAWDLQVRPDLETLSQVVASLDLSATSSDAARSVIFDLRRSRDTVENAAFADCAAPAREQALAVIDAASGMFQGIYENNPQNIEQNRSLLTLAYQALFAEYNRLNYPIAGIRVEG